MSSTDELIKYIEGSSAGTYRIEDYSRDRRFAFWYVLSQLATPGPQDDPGSLDLDGSRRAVTVAPDGGIDAIRSDGNGCLHLVQSKLHTTRLGSKQGPNDIEYLNRWASLLCDPSATFAKVKRGPQKLAGATKELLETARGQVLSGEVTRLCLHFVSTRVMEAEETHWEQDVPGRDPIQVTYVPVGHDRVGFLFENFMAGVPPVGKLTWRVARSTQQARDSGWDASNGLRLTHLLIPGDEIREAVDKYRWQLFASNVRLDLGGENPVNAEIRASIRREPGLFHLLNNGLTITCDESTVLERERVDLEMVNPQIVNGQQTSWALHDAKDAAANALVPVKLITINRPQFDGEPRVLITRVARATNRQSGIAESDLRTNDACQIEISHRLLAYELHYARKQGRTKRAEAGGRKVVSMLGMADAVGNCLWESVAHRNTKELLFKTREEGTKIDYYAKIFDPDQIRRNLTCFFLSAEVAVRAGRKGGGVRSNTSEDRSKQIHRMREQGKWLALFFIYRELGDELVERADRFIKYGRTNKADREAAVTSALDGVIEPILGGIVRFYEHGNGRHGAFDDISRYFKTADLNNQFTPFFRSNCRQEKARFKRQRMSLLKAL